MKSLALAVAMLLCGTLGAVQLHAQPEIGDFGFGLILAEPTGITLKGGIGNRNAWDLALGSSWFGDIRIHGDYLWNVDAFNSREVGLYFGLGAVVGFGASGGVVFKNGRDHWYYREKGDGAAFGARAVAGVNAMPFNAPVELFFEVAPLIGLSPATGFGTDLALGIRYYP